MKKLFKNILLTTTAVAGIIIPSTIVAKQSNYVEATETSTLTPFIVPVGIYGNYSDSNTEARVNESMQTTNAMLYFEVDQLYDLGIISTDLTKTDNMDFWVASSIELKNNIHISGSYHIKLAQGASDTIYHEVDGTFTEAHVPPAPFLTEDYDFEMNSNGEIVNYSVNDKTEYLGLTLFNPFETIIGASNAGYFELVTFDLTIDEFYYTTTNDQTTQHTILVTDLLRADDVFCNATNAEINSDSYDNTGLTETERVTYTAYPSEFYSNDIESGISEFNITSDGTTTPYMDLTVAEFSTAGGSTPWYVWAFISVGVIAVIGLAWWAIHALRNRRSTKKEETKA